MTGPGASPVLPGSTIGLVGGGQLGRMTAMAARSLGYRVAVLDPDAHCAARGVCDQLVRAAFDDERAARDFASRVDVVTCEREDVALASLVVMERSGLLRPGLDVLRVVQDRAAQKHWLEKHGFPVGPYRACTSQAELADAFRDLGKWLRLKSTRGGFDGRSQWRVTERDRQTAWKRLGGTPLVAERELDVSHELSVMVARSAGGQSLVYPVAHNIHSDGVLVESVLPGDFEPSLALRATELAAAVADQLRVVGLLAVEMFVTSAGELLINEVAARPHNTFHTTEFACETSQFEQLVRAICGLPLGDTSVHRPTALANLFGDLWLSGSNERLVGVLGTKGVHLRLYGKVPRPRRKLGHIAVSAPRPEEALQGIRALRAHLELGHAPPREGS